MGDGGSTPDGCAAELGQLEHDTWEAFLGASESVLAALQIRLEAEARMSLASYRILDALASAPGEALRMGALAERLGASSSRLAHATRRLEESSRVRRQASPSDGRGQVAVLTEAGRAALRVAAPVRAEVVRRHLLAPLSAHQVAQLRRIGEAVRDRVVSATPPARERPAGREPG